MRSMPGISLGQESHDGDDGMTGKGITLRTIYMRVTIDGKRQYVDIGYINNKGKIHLWSGMPNPGWWD